MTKSCLLIDRLACTRVALLPVIFFDSARSLTGRHVAVRNNVPLMAPPPFIVTLSLNTGSTRAWHISLRDFGRTDRDCQLLSWLR